jgi:phenylacetate-CoA ligase
MRRRTLRNGYWTAYTLWHARAEATLPFRPLDEITALQNRRVRGVVAHAYDSVPYYREVMDAARLDPRDVHTADDLARLPVLSGAELARDPQRFLSSRYANGRALRLRSSGTSGYSKAIWYHAAALFLSLAHGHRQRHVLAHFVGRTYGYREMHLAREGGVAHQIREFYESHSWVPSKVELQRSRASPGERFEDTIARVNTFKPDVVRGYGAHIGALFRFASRHHLPLHRPKCVAYGADHMADADRALIEDEFGTPVVSMYQATEALRIGFQCEERKAFHVSVDHTAVRVVDAQGKPAAPGTKGEIVISNLVNHASVLLNYRLGDVVTVSAEPCPCGRTLPTIEAIDGRADDFIILDDGRKIHALVVLGPLLRVAGVVQLQLIQESARRFGLKVVRAPQSVWTSVCRDLSAALHSTVGESLALDIEEVDAIAPEAGGKVRALISWCHGGASAEVARDS